MNVARIAALRAGMPIESSAMTINRYCASGLQAIALAAERIRGGGAEVDRGRRDGIHVVHSVRRQQDLHQSLAAARIIRIPTCRWG